MKSLSAYKSIREIIDDIDPANNEPAISYINQKKQNTITFGQLKQQVKALGNGLISIGIQKGDKIGIVSENRIEWIISYLSIVSIGAVVVPFDTLMKEKEILQSIQKTKIKLQFCSSNHLKKISNIFDKADSLKHIVSFDKADSLLGKDSPKPSLQFLNKDIETLIQNSEHKIEQSNFTCFDTLLHIGELLAENNFDQYSKREVLPADEAALILMEGTTFAVLVHEALANNVRAYEVFVITDTLKPGEKALAPLPFHHTYPIMAGVLSPLFHELHVVLLARTNAKSIVQAVKDTGAKYISCVPMVLEGIKEELEKEPAKIDSLEYIIVGGAPVKKSTMVELNKLGYLSIQGYGLTEYCPIVSTSYPFNNKFGSVGKLFFRTEAKIVKPDQNGKGEIYVKGASLMKGYFEDKAKTEATITPDGWLKTGDLGKIDSDGYLYITGRKKRVVVTQGGKNIYPEDVEAVLHSSEYIDHAFVYPFIDTELGEIPVAAVVVNKEKIGEHALKTDDEIIDFLFTDIKKLCNDKAIYKRPAKIVLANDSEDLKKYQWNGFDYENVYIDIDDSQTETENIAVAYNPEAVANFLAKYLKYSISELASVSIEEIDIEKSFMEFLDSIEITTISEHLLYEIKVNLSPIDLFEYKTIKDLSRFFACNFKDEVQAYFGDALLDLSETETSSGEQEDIAADNAENIQFQTEGSAEQKLAIIGADGLFPSSSNLDEFWENLESCKSLISNIVEKRFNDTSLYGETTAELDLPVDQAGIVDSIECFDPLFFGISPKEASLMDPQQRLLLQVVWNTIENAGYTPESLGRKTGVFVGASSWDYFMLGSRFGIGDEVYAALGNAHSIISNRLSFLFNFNGPSETVDTACSSSLVALHSARKAILAGSCECAIVAGVNALLEPSFFKSFYNAGMLSKDGRCKTFDNSANGYVRGEGVGAVLLKPLDKAIKDGDHILGVLRSSSVNHVGKSSSLTAPDPNIQSELIYSAYKEAGIKPTEVSYIEAHGTGTSLGDPIEINGLKKAFNKLNSLHQQEPLPEGYCNIGSAKTNIGHLESAAGIAGLIKVLLSLKNKKLPGLVNFNKLNQYIDLKKSPFYISDKTTEWKQLADKNGKLIPRIAGISSFGFGGANAHAVIEEFEGNNYKSKPNTSKQLLILSAKNHNALISKTEDLKNFVLSPSVENDDLANISASLISGREEMDERLAIIASDKQQLLQALEKFIATHKSAEGIFCGNIKQTAFDIEQLFDGNDGAGYINTIIEQNKIAKLAHLWVLGCKVNWAAYLAKQKFCKIPLPSYPFAGEKHWFSLKKDTLTTNSTGQISPLLHYNASTINRLCFKTKLDLSCKLLNYCKLQGTPLLTFGISLGMIAEGIYEVTEAAEFKIEDMKFAGPVEIADTSNEFELAFYPTVDHIAFELQQIHSSGDTEAVIQGKAILKDQENNTSSFHLNNDSPQYSSSVTFNSQSNAYSIQQGLFTLEESFVSENESSAFYKTDNQNKLISAGRFQPLMIDWHIPFILQQETEMLYIESVASITFHQNNSKADESHIFQAMKKNENLYSAFNWFNKDGEAIISAQGIRLCPVISSTNNNQEYNQQKILQE